MVDTGSRDQDNRLPLARILAQFAFHLSADWEVRAGQDTDTASLRLGVREMLARHHLFSWDT